MRRLRKARRGGAALELAFVTPIFLALILGEVETSRIGMFSQLLTNAAREGCRVAVINGMDQDDVNARIASTLNGSGINVGSVQAVSADPGTPGAYIMPANWASAPANTPVTLVLRVSYTSATGSQSGTASAIIPLPSYAGIKLNGQATMNSERP